MRKPEKTDKYVIEMLNITSAEDDVEVHKAHYIARVRRANAT